MKNDKPCSISSLAVYIHKDDTQYQISESIGRVRDHVLDNLRAYIREGLRLSPGGVVVNISVTGENK